MNGETSLGRVGAPTGQWRRLTLVRLLLTVGWALAAAGFFAPWIAHQAVGLTLSGVDMGEFVKFLPDALDGSARVYRQLFYLPPIAICVSTSLLVSSKHLRLPWPVQAVAICIAVLASLQLLPPAWSPPSLVSPEFRLQTIALAACWLLLAVSWLLAALPPWLAGSLSATLCLAALSLALWQYLAIRPSIDEVYGAPPPTGWGLPICLIGLSIAAVAGLIFVQSTAARSRNP